MPACSTSWAPSRLPGVHIRQVAAPRVPSVPRGGGSNLRWPELQRARHHRRQLACGGPAHCGQRSSTRSRAATNTSSTNHQEPTPDPEPFDNPVLGLCLYSADHAACTLLGCYLGDAVGLGLTDQLRSTSGVSLPAALAGVVLVGALIFMRVPGTDTARDRKQLERNSKELYTLLRGLSFWGVGVLALGAGVFEETVFRGFLQSAAIQLFGTALPDTAAAAAGVAVASVLFGLAHDSTPTKFFFTTGAGVVFGVVYLACGLQTAVASHFLYDWALFALIKCAQDEAPSGRH